MIAALSVCVQLGCTGAGTSGPDSSPSGPRCNGVSRAALSTVDRKVIGIAAPYVADGTLRGRDAELAASQRLRREVAWDTARKVLERVAIVETLPAAAGLPPGALPSDIPAWQTWYDLSDLRRVFYRLYESLSSEQRQSRTRFADSDLDDTFLWNTTAVDELPTWPADRYQTYVEAIDEASEVAGLGGITRVTYSPGAARHFLQSYPDVLACRANGTPPEKAVGPLVETPVVRAAVLAGACERQVVGTYAIETDESLYAVLEDGGDAQLSLTTDSESCDAGADQPCEIFGPAMVQVVVTSAATATRGVVSITRRSTRPTWSACVDEAFPIDAVVVKADYRRVDFGMTVPVYATSAVSLKERLSGAFSWDEADGQADPPPSEIYTLTLPNGTQYRLAALHIMSKELDHWLWTSLWWSSTPDMDFGEDRPAAIEALGGPWDQYKMCAVSAFEEGDPLAGGGFDESHPTLAQALTAAYSGVGSPTWCSNPYLERGEGNADTNCIGCHQHGGTELRSEDILSLSDHGRTLIRNNFPADYSWASKDGDNLEQLFADAELYFIGKP